MARRDSERFERVVLPHLDDAYTLARYLLRDEHDAQDAVQDAALRALRYFETYREGDARAWLLAIVRNSCYTLQRRRRNDRSTISIGEDHVLPTLHDPHPADAEAIAASERLALERALGQLPVEFREVI